MGQKIQVKIADREFPYTVTSPEMEQCIRKAAELVNNKIREMDKYSRTVEDKMLLASLSIAVNYQEALRRMAALKGEVESMELLTEHYLEDIDRK